MTVFANNKEQTDFEEKYCQQCLNLKVDKNSATTGCAVMDNLTSSENNGILWHSMAKGADSVQCEMFRSVRCNGDDFYVDTNGNVNIDYLRDIQLFP